MKKYVVIALLVPIFFFDGAKPADALFGDWVLVAKELGGDLVSWLLSAGLLDQVTQQTTEWVTGGFEQTVRQVVFDAAGNPIVRVDTGRGDPSFVINSGAFFENVSTDSIKSFLDEFQAADGDMGVVLEGFGEQLMFDILRETHRVTDDFFEQFRTTFQTEEDRMVREQFLEDFTQGGWATFLETVQCPNDYSCARLVFLGEARARAEQAVEEARTDLEQGGGFLTMRKCADFDEETGVCRVYESVTPGNLISEQIAASTRVELERIAGADEITEVIALILGGVVNSLIQEGLSGIERQFAATTPEERRREAQRRIQIAMGQPDGCVSVNPIFTEIRICADANPAQEGNQANIVLTRGNPVAEVTITLTGVGPLGNMTYTGSVTVDGFGDHKDKIEVNPNVVMTRSVMGRNESATLRIGIRRDALGEIEDLGDLRGFVQIGRDNEPHLLIGVQGEGPREEERAEEAPAAPPAGQ